MKFLIALTLLTLTACSGMSLQSRAEATYGSFVVTEKSAAELIQSPNVPDSTKVKIQAADTAAKPVADALLAAILGYRVSPANADALQRALSVAIPAIATFAKETAP